MEAFLTRAARKRAPGPGPRPPAPRLPGPARGLRPRWTAAGPVPTVGEMSGPVGTVDAPPGQAGASAVEPACVEVTASRDAARAALEAAGLTHEIVTYPGANHAFFNDTGPRYNPEVAAQAYAKVLDWFGRHLG